MNELEQLAEQTAEDIYNEFEIEMTYQSPQYYRMRKMIRAALQRVATNTAIRTSSCDVDECPCECHQRATRLPY